MKNLIKKLIVGLVVLNIAALFFANLYFNNTNSDSIVRINKFNIFNADANVTDNNTIDVVDWSKALYQYFRK